MTTPSTVTTSTTIKDGGFFWRKTRRRRRRWMRRKRRTMRRIGKIIGERFYDKQLVRGGEGAPIKQVINNNFV